MTIACRGAGAAEAPAACIGAGTCRSPASACRPSDAPGIVLLAAADPSVLAHEALNSLSVLCTVARRLLSPDAHAETAVAMRTIAVERAARLGWALDALRPGIDEAAAARAAGLVLAGCALKRWYGLAQDERERSLRQIVDGTAEVAADLRRVVGGHSIEVDLRR